MKTIYLILAVLLVSCSNENKDETIPTNKPRSEQVDTNMIETNLVSRVAGGEAYEAGGEKKDKLQNSLDSVTIAIRLWNKCINTNETTALHKIYDDEVQFYRKKVQKSDLIQSKKTWLDKHPNYSQKIDIREIQHPAEAKGTIRCLFIKEYKDATELKKVNSILEFQLIEGNYLITKESDVPTEISLIKDEKAQELDSGELFFQHDYWLDTRGDHVLAHDFVPYTIGVSISNEDKLEVGFDSYSGSLRESRQYYTKDAVYKDGFLSFKAAPWWHEKYGDEINPAEIKEEDYQFHKFKILDNHIALVECDGWFEELVGTRFW